MAGEPWVVFMDHQAEAAENEQEELNKHAGNNLIVFESKISCNECEKKVRKAIESYPGVENVTVQDRNVIIRGNVDAKKLFQAATKKTDKITQILQPPQKDDKKKDKKKLDEHTKTEIKDVSVLIKTQIHCKGCEKEVQKFAMGIKGVYEAVVVDGETLLVKGKGLDGKKLCDEIKKGCSKHVEIIQTQTQKKSSENDNAGVKKEGNNKFNADYVFAPQYFSDENPNSCLIM